MCAANTRGQCSYNLAAQSGSLLLEAKTAVTASDAFASVLSEVFCLFMFR